MNRYQFEIIKNSVEKMLDQGAQKRVLTILEKLHEADIAMLIEYFLPRQKKKLFNLLYINNVTLSSKVVSELDSEMAIDLLKGMSIDHISKILQEMSTDDAAELVSSFPEDLQEKIIETMRAKDSKDIQDLLQYPEDTAGRIMSHELLALDENISVTMAIKTIQKKKDVETVFYLYVVNDYGHLLGVISLRQLLLAQPKTLLKNVMNTDVVSVTPVTDQEEVARLVGRYNLIAIPVTTEENKLLGVVTVDDIIDIIREEATEDFLKLAGVGEEDISDRSVLKNVMGRAPWLFAAWIGGLFGAYIISTFDHLLQTILILAAFIPVIAGMGGNVGTQAATLVVRGIALGKVNIERFWRVVSREVAIASALGALYGISLGLAAHFLYGQPIEIGIIVGVSLVISIIIAAAVGSMVPLILHRFHIDPAIATGPFVTTAIDVMGIFIYLTLGSAFLL